MTDADLTSWSALMSRSPAFISCYGLRVYVGVEEELLCFTGVNFRLVIHLRTCDLEVVPEVQFPVGSLLREQTNIAIATLFTLLRHSADDERDQCVVIERADVDILCPTRCEWIGVLQIFQECFLIHDFPIGTAKDELIGEETGKEPSRLVIALLLHFPHIHVQFSQLLLISSNPHSIHVLASLVVPL